MVSVMENGSKALGSRLGRVIVLCSWAKHFTLQSTRDLSGKPDEMLGG